VIEILLEAERARADGDLDLAERLFLSVAEHDPRNAIAEVGLARIALARGDAATARALASRALEIDPESPSANHLLEGLASSPDDRTPTAESQAAAGQAPAVGAAAPTVDSAAAAASAWASARAAAEEAAALWAAAQSAADRSAGPPGIAAPHGDEPAYPAPAGPGEGWEPIDGEEEISVLAPEPLEEAPGGASGGAPSGPATRSPSDGGPRAEPAASGARPGLWTRIRRLLGFG
jgi:hypothetical protein